MDGQVRASQFDERQVHIRGQVAYHALLVAVGLLLINACLLVTDTVWASGFVQNLFMLFVTMAVFSSESILRGAYFGRTQNHWAMICVLGVVGVSMCVSRIVALSSGGGGAFTTGDSIALLIAGVGFMVTAVVGVWKERADGAGGRRR